LLLWVNTPGVISIVALQALAAFAVWRYFRRNQHTESAARTLVAPLAAGILLTGAARRRIRHPDAPPPPAVYERLVTTEVDAEVLAASPDPQASASLA
jgi:hypothetical protein